MGAGSGRGRVGCTRFFMLTDENEVISYFCDVFRVNEEVSDMPGRIMRNMSSKLESYLNSPRKVATKC